MRSTKTWQMEAGCFETVVPAIVSVQVCTYHHFIMCVHTHRPAPHCPVVSCCCPPNKRHWTKQWNDGDKGKNSRIEEREEKEDEEGEEEQGVCSLISCCWIEFSGCGLLNCNDKQKKHTHTSLCVCVCFGFFFASKRGSVNSRHFWISH